MILNMITFVLVNGSLLYGLDFGSVPYFVNICLLAGWSGGLGDSIDLLLLSTKQVNAKFFL